MVNHSVNNTYRTSDTSLSAYLLSEGYILLDIEYEGDRAFFIFDDDDPKLRKSIREFQSARAKGNIVLFFNAYQNLLRRIKERY